MQNNQVSNLNHIFWEFNISIQQLIATKKQNNSPRPHPAPRSTVEVGRLLFLNVLVLGMMMNLLCRNCEKHEHLYFEWPDSEELEKQVRSDCVSSYCVFGPRLGHLSAADLPVSVQDPFEEGDGRSCKRGSM